MREEPGDRLIPDEPIPKAGLFRVINCAADGVKDGPDRATLLCIAAGGLEQKRLSSGQRLDAYFKQHIFDPVGMTDTSFILSSAQRARLVPVQIRNADGSFGQSGFEVSQTPEMFMGGAGLSGTVRDYIKFLQALLNKASNWP